MSTDARVPSIDVLRGLCLLGILVMNIQSFALPHAAYLVPTTYGSLEGADGVAWAIGRLFFDFKFISLFSFLFGASLVLGGEATRPRRRLGWLIAFGMMHGYLIWYGDVLFTYGIIGLVLLGAIDWPVRRQLATGATLLVVSSLVPAMAAPMLDQLPWLAEDLSRHTTDASVATELAAFRGSWLDQLPTRASLAFENHVPGTLLEAGWRAAGCMLVGMGATRSGFFERPPRLAVLLACLVVGLLVTGAGMAWVVLHGFEIHAWLVGQTLHELGSIGVAAAFAGLVVTLALRTRGPFMVGCARLGRVAFTAYLTQSLVLTWVFGGHGLGLFGQLGRAELFGLALAFWALQWVLADQWGRRFRVGPLEALWRGLSRGAWSLGPIPRVQSGPGDAA